MIKMSISQPEIKMKIDPAKVVYQGGGAPPAASDITFYDYDGTIVAAWTLKDLANKTALPDYPMHDGLICQGWNWSLEDLKSANGKMNVGALYTTIDGKTRIYIHLEEGRTSPMLGICPDGVVTVDWGDGTEPDILSGDSTDLQKFTPAHNYSAPGDYVITLSIDGSAGFVGGSTGTSILQHTSDSDNRNRAYWNSVKGIECGAGIAKIGANAFGYCYSLAFITIPDNSEFYLDASAFRFCYALKFIALPRGLLDIKHDTFRSCTSLASIALPNGITGIGDNAFTSCDSLKSVAVPDSVSSIGQSAFDSCSNLSSVKFSNALETISASAFTSDNRLESVVLPDTVTSLGSAAFSRSSCGTSVILSAGLQSIPSNAFSNWGSITSIAIPSNIKTIGTSAFNNCYSMKTYDFTAHTSVPSLANRNAFNGIPEDCRICVPAALLDEWKAATNWSYFADQIVGV